MKTLPQGMWPEVEALQRTAQDPVVLTNNLRKTYGRVVALDDLSVQIPRASVGLLGANGAGKSTLIKLLLGLHRATAGEATLLGKDVAREAIAIRERVGYMPEADCLPLDVTAADFVGHMAEMSGLPPRAARLRAAETLYHCGIDEERYRRMREFSTGMKQRVKLAQAIVHDPDLVFLDEPTNGMDPTGRDDMLRLIGRIHRELGIAVVLSSHILEDVEHVCDYVVMLDHGRLAAVGAVEDLMRGDGEVIVEIDGDVDAFAARITAAGLTVSRRGSGLGIAHRNDGAFDVIRDVAADLGVGLRTLRISTRSLEDVYMQQLGATVAAGGSRVQPAR